MQNVYFTKSKSLAGQYWEVGKINAKYITNEVTKNKRKRSHAKLLRRKILFTIEQRLKKESQFTEFYACLRAWAEGANINVADALELLDDNTGCQTAMGRYENGIVLIHTEEELDDIKARMTAPQIVAFNIEGETKYTLIYNNMLPGAAVYGWGPNYAIAVDALFLNEDGVEKLERPILANIVSWLIWRNSKDNWSVEAILKLINAAGNCVDGYTINLVHKTQKIIEGYKITFARNITEVEKLGNKAGSTLRQLNIIEPKYIEAKRPIANCRLPYQRFYRGYWNYYKVRLQTIDRNIEKYMHYLLRKISKPEKAQKKIIEELTGPLANDYMNEVVGAVCTTLIDETKTSTAIGLIENERLKKILSF